MVVAGAHAGAGATTAALAIAVTAAETAAVRLIECAAPYRSGLAAAADTELGADADGWRLGRRGRLMIERRETPATLDPREQHRHAVNRRGAAVCIIDIGCVRPDSDVLMLWARMGARIVLVHRVSVPGVRAAELALTCVEGCTPFAIGVGAVRWPAIVHASCGPSLRQTRDAGNAATFPADAELAVSGVTADPLPRRLLAAARDSLPHLFADSRTRALDLDSDLRRRRADRKVHPR